MVFDNIKQEPEIEEIMDYYTEEDHIENSNESCEITPTPVDSQPVGTNNSGCFCHVCNREFQNKVAFQRHMLVSICCILLPLKRECFSETVLFLSIMIGAFLKAQAVGGGGLLPEQDCN